MHLFGFLLPCLILCHSRHFSSIFSSVKISFIGGTFAAYWIRSVDLWCQKQPLYPLSHDHCPSRYLVCMAKIFQYAESIIEINPSKKRFQSTCTLVYCFCPQSLKQFAFVFEYHSHPYAYLSLGILCIFFSFCRNPIWLTLFPTFYFSISFFLSFLSNLVFIFIPDLGNILFSFPYSFCLSHILLLPSFCHLGNFFLHLSFSV